jgi:chromosome segregation ATPase
MNQKPNASENPEGLFATVNQQHAESTIETPKVLPQLEATVLRFWETVRKSADIIVTLRQENTILSNQLQQMRHAEATLNDKINGFLERIQVLEEEQQRHSDVVANDHNAQLLQFEEREHPLAVENEQLNNDIQQLRKQLLIAQQRANETDVLVETLTKVQADLSARNDQLSELHHQLEQVLQESERVKPFDIDGERDQADDQQISMFTVPAATLTATKAPRANSNQEQNIDDDLEACALRIEAIADMLQFRTFVANE